MEYFFDTSAIVKIYHEEEGSKAILPIYSGNDSILIDEKETKMTQKDYEIAKRLKDRLSDDIQLVDFMVFGSRARGDMDEYTDMDVFIEVEYIDKELEDKIYHIAWEVGLEYSLFISPLVFSRYEIEDSPLKASPIVKNIEEEGVKV